MTDARSVSVIVVSHGRPDALARCLTSLTQLTYPMFEIVVVADKAGLNRLDMLPQVFGKLKIGRFDNQNISHARNMGVALAAGDIAAFIDDDAVAEPNWLQHIAAPFDDDRVMSAGGTVIGRNGFSVQWGPRCIFPTGQCAPVAVNGSDPALFFGRPGLGIKTEGTNMAFRRYALVSAGGFDPAYAFYLEESDLNLRLAADGHAAALVPNARVHHGFHQSVRRRADRIPNTLYDVGASLAVFLRKHQPEPLRHKAVKAERDQRRSGLLRHMVLGGIEPRDVGRILTTFDAGYADGLTRKIEALPKLPEPGQPFLRFQSDIVRADNWTVLSNRSWKRKALVAQAGRLANEGKNVLVQLFSPTMRHHRIEYRMPGYWLQSGGLFGKSRRDDPAFRLWSFKSRADHEARGFGALRTQAGLGNDHPSPDGNTSAD